MQMIQCYLCTVNPSVWMRSPYTKERNGSENRRVRNVNRYYVNAQDIVDAEDHQRRGPTADW